MDERSLIQQLKSGSHQALEETVHVYTHYVTAVAARNLATDRLRKRRETEVIPLHLPDGQPGPEERPGRAPQLWLGHHPLRACHV